MPLLALAWLLHRTCVTTVIAGARRPEQICATVAAADARLSDDVMAAIADATRPLKVRIGDNADIWRANGRIR